MYARNLITIWLCKLIYWGLRRIGRHGAALPGLIAETLNPQMIRMLRYLPDGIIVVSGTNGKTTTTHLVSTILQKSGKKVFTNHSGSNMTRGLLASIIRYSSLSGHLPYDVAVLEIDEAYASKLSETLQPRACILTNVYRDQLDRFGEIDYTAKLLHDLAKNCTELVVYNINDTRLVSIPSVINNSARAVSFGFDKRLTDVIVNDDDRYSKTKASADVTPDYTLQEYVNNLSTIRSPESVLRIKCDTLPSDYNQVNLTAAITLVSELYPDLDHKYFDNLTPPYGRGEKISVNSSEVVLQLVKNPAGFDLAMHTLNDKPALIIINDAIADGRDVSWLWDVDFKPLVKRPRIYISGDRAFDMANRLKYCDVSTHLVDTSIDQVLRRFIADNREGVIFSTYTGMLKARRTLKKMSNSTGDKNV